MFLQHRHGSEEEPWRAASILLGWRPPRVGVYKINIDGAYNSRKVGIGVVVRDHVGDIISVATQMHGMISMTHVEAMAVWNGIELAGNINLPQFVI